MSTREASWLAATGPEFLMGSGERLHYLLLKVPSQQARSAGAR